MKTPANLGVENVFGKQRGRYDEMMASRLARSLPDQCFGMFMSMDDAGRAEFADRLNTMSAKMPYPFWRMERTKL